MREEIAGNGGASSPFLGIESEGGPELSASENLAVNSDF
jgi:hypothetical protein